MSLRNVIEAIFESHEHWLRLTTSPLKKKKGGRKGTGYRNIYQERGEMNLQVKFLSARLHYQWFYRACGPLAPGIRNERWPLILISIKCKSHDTGHLLTFRVILASLVVTKFAPTIALNIIAAHCRFMCFLFFTFTFFSSSVYIIVR